MNIIINNQSEFFKYLKSKFPLYHLSNVFFRDLHYGVMNFLQGRNVKIKYFEAEEITKGVIDHLEKQNILKKVDKQTWVLNYPEYLLPKVKKAS